MSIVFSGQTYWIPILLVLSLLLAYFMYFGLKRPVKKQFSYPNGLLFILRFLSILTLCILLLAPYLKYKSKTKYKPSITFLVDHSLSVKNQEGILEYYKEFIKEAKNKLTDYQLNFKNLSGEELSDSINIKEGTTDLTKGLENIVEKRTYNEKAIVVLSDGIINQGANPNYYPLAISKPIYSLGLGDTSTLKDIKVSDAKSNDFVLLGNDFPVAFNIMAYECKGISINYSVSLNGKVIHQGNTTANDQNYFMSKQVTLSAKQPGTQRILIRTTTLDEEKNKSNNLLELYVNVLDNRKKIAILHQGVHPDVKAIKTALKAQKNYETFVTDNIGKAMEADAIAAIQVPNIGNTQVALQNLINSKKPVLLVGGEMLEWRAWAGQIGQINIRTSRPNTAKFKLNKAFGGFSTDEEDALVLDKLPPLTVPFAIYPNELNVMAYQSVNGVSTDYPLIAVKSNKRRMAIIFGEGIWRWSMREYKYNQNHKPTENLIDHLLQWLLTGRDKPLFSVSPSKSRYDKNDEIILKSELYNQVFEPINNATIKARVFNDSFSREVSFSNEGSYYSSNMGNLPSGTYQVVAKHNNKTVSSGFSVTASSIEEINLKANWRLLSSLSQNYKGAFYPHQNYDLLLNELNTKVSKTIISKETKELKDLIQIPYLILLLGLLLGSEWILRKYYGKL